MPPHCPSACHGSFPAVTSARTGNIHLQWQTWALGPELVLPCSHYVGQERVGRPLWVEAAQATAATGEHKVLRVWQRPEVVLLLPTETRAAALKYNEVFVRQTGLMISGVGSNSVL